MKASKIVVDQQSHFNKAQRTLAEFYANARNIKLVNGPGLPEIDYSSMPNTPITFAASIDSAGLELADIHLWIFKRFIEKKDLPNGLCNVIAFQANRGITDEISIKGIEERWSKWFHNLLDPTEDQIKKAQELSAFDEEKRLRAVQDISS